MRRLRENGIDPLPVAEADDCGAEAGVGSGRDARERIAEKPPHGHLTHVAADEPHLALAVGAQRAQGARPFQARRRRR